MSKPILIVLAGKAFPGISKNQGDFGEWIAAGLGVTLPHKIVDAHELPVFPAPTELAGVVVSGSHAMVTDQEAWSERLAGWLKSCVEVDLPVLGICYGHQLLAHALGGVVSNNPAGLEIGTRVIELTEGAEGDFLLSGLPQSFPAQLVHYQSVLQLPPGATLLAHSALEPHQAYRIGSAWGIQFHPEFSADVMRGYINQLRDRLDDHAALIACVRDTPVAANLLQRFAVLGRSLI